MKKIYGKNNIKYLIIDIFLLLILITNIINIILIIRQNNSNSYNTKYKVIKVKDNNIFAYNVQIKKKIYSYQKQGKRPTITEVYNMFNPIYDYVIKTHWQEIKKLPLSKKELKILWTAQIIKETGYLVSSINYTYFNLLGIKKNKYLDYPYFEKITKEYINGKWINSNEKFACFYGYEDNFVLWLNKITKNKLYAQSLKANDVYEFIDKYTKIWATDPNYAKSLKYYYSLTWKAIYEN